MALLLGRWLGCQAHLYRRVFISAIVADGAVAFHGPSTDQDPEVRPSQFVASPPEHEPAQRGHVAWSINDHFDRLACENS